MTDSRVPGCERPLLLTVRQAAQAAHISRSHAYQLVNSGVWPSIRLGKSRRIPAAWITRWIDEKLHEWDQARRRDNGCG